MLISSTFVPDVYGLMRHILCRIFVAPYCYVTVSLVQHCVITNGPLYGISYFYTVLLVHYDVQRVYSVTLDRFIPESPQKSAQSDLLISIRRFKNIVQRK